MQVGTAHSIGNPNEAWLDSRGAWLTYILLIIIGHLVILSVPFLDTATAWTITNTVHNVSVFLVLHYLKGTPFETSDQGRSRRLTHWEQIDQGTQFTLTRKFFTLVPILLFMITSFYTNYDGVHFLVNAVSLVVLSLIPKFPQMYKVRLFGLNKY
ncbi:ORM1-like protein 3 [Actinia tenebrosa]|uniref:ORM1-like protein 3 n=1 Tax=Actinia tenebrosa TaxID=6105 RepID=A0A6P8IZR8_ACTTE|nr:ORM1-like protein 3 [Actinia tenebrosa]